MAVTEDMEKQALTAADKAIPDFSVDSNDPRLTQVKSEEDKALAEDEALFGNMIGSTDKLYDQQIQGVKDWESTQIANQQEQTDFAIEKIEQQKGQATEDYKKEQSASFVDWQKQSNQYGANAEKMASAGLTNTGYSESSQVAMYNQYQNRVATAREVYNRAILNYDNAIKDAILQNNATLAEIAITSLQQQIDLAINKVMYNNNLVLQLSDKKMQTKQFHFDKWRTVYDQLSNEKALGWDAQKYYDTQAWNEAQQKEEREFTASENEKDRKWKEEEAEKDRAHDFEVLEKQQSYKSASGSSGGSSKSSSSGSGGSSKSSSSGGSSKINKSSGSSKIHNQAVADLVNKTALTYASSSYEGAVAYMKSQGVPSANASAAMTQDEWSERKTSYAMTGQGGAEVKNYGSYPEYLNDYIRYCVQTYGK